MSKPSLQPKILLLLAGALTSVALLLSPVACVAGRIPEEWDDLPQVGSISFSRTSVGLDGGYILDRATKQLREVTPAQFEQAFAGSPAVPAAEVTKEEGIESTVLLRTSNGKQFLTRNSYCDEGGDSSHTLTMDGVPVKDHIRPCNSVSCAEIVGNDLWLGSRHDGEYGDYPAEGISVQSLDKGVPVRRLTTEDGLTGDLIRAIRVDPFDDDAVWVTTNEGINVVGRDFRVRESLFFYRDVDPASGAPMVGLSPVRRASNPMAMLLLGMRTSNAAQFYTTAQQIPAAVWERFRNRTPDFRREPGDNMPAIDEAFAPPEMNVLVPLYLEDAQSSDERVRTAALSHLCTFNDRRAIDLLVEQRELHGKDGDSFRTWNLPACLDRYTRYGLVTPRQQEDHKAALLRKEKEALERIRAARLQGAMDDIRLATSSAGELRRAGDRRGIELINDYFRTIPGLGDATISEEVVAQLARNAQFYSWIGTNLGGDDDFAPAMLEGLRKLRHNRNVARTGCAFFDMRPPEPRRRFDAKYAEVILVVIDGRGPQGAPPQGAEDFCVEAFRSQLTGPGVREAFFRDVYPQLTPSQKELADRLAKDPPGPRLWY